MPGTWWASDRPARLPNGLIKPVANSAGMRNLYRLKLSIMDLHRLGWEEEAGKVAIGRFRN